MTVGQRLLTRALKKYGGHQKTFAHDILGRSRVSVWRWLRGTHPLPQAVIDRLRTYLAQ